MNEYFFPFDGAQKDEQIVNLGVNKEKNSFNTKKKVGCLPNWVIYSLIGDGRIEVYRNGTTKVLYKFHYCWARYSYNTGIFVIGAKMAHKNPGQNSSWQR
jgi:hypothetical protein